MSSPIVRCKKLIQEEKTASFNSIFRELLLKAVFLSTVQLNQLNFEWNLKHVFFWIKSEICQYIY